MAKTKDGRSLPIQLGITEINTVWGERMFAGFCRDVRREQFDEEEMREREQVSNAIIEALTNPLLTIDEHGRIYKANKTACRFFGYKSQEFLVLNLSMLFGPQFAGNNNVLANEDMVEFVKRSNGRTTSVEMRKKSGAVCQMHMRLVQIDGAFPILFGANAHIGSPPAAGTSMYAAFLQENPNEQPFSGLVDMSTSLRNLAGVLKKLASDQAPAMEETESDLQQQRFGEDGTAESSSGSLGGLLEGFSGSVRNLTSGNNKDTEIADSSPGCDGTDSDGDVDYITEADLVFGVR